MEWSARRGHRPRLRRDRRRYGAGRSGFGPAHTPGRDSSSSDTLPSSESAGVKKPRQIPYKDVHVYCKTPASTRMHNNY